jgi:hypothetical protein
LSDKCPEIEILAAYVDHNLTLDEQQQVESHLIVCTLCRQVVILTSRSKDSILDINDSPSANS